MVKLTDIRPGDILLADNGFDCLHKGEACTVRYSSHGPYVDCEAGTHSLAGQVDEDGNVVGFEIWKNA